MPKNMILADMKSVSLLTFINAVDNLIRVVMNKISNLKKSNLCVKKCCITRNDQESCDSNMTFSNWLYSPV